MESSNAQRSGSSSRKKWRGIGIVIRLIATLLFVLGIYGSIRLGISMASNRVPQLTEKGGTVSESTRVTLGGSGNPVYLAESPDALRTFFSKYATPGERASADLTDANLRRITGEIEVTTLQIEADAVAVRVSSGPIAGAEYWIHHSQMPDNLALDPIISPLPSPKE